MRTTSLNRPTLITVIGLVTGAAGLLVQKAGGVEMPPVPPGLVILGLAAVLIVVSRWRWTLVLGVLAALAEIPGFVGSAVDADAIGEIAGASVRGIGATTALIAGITATVVAYRSRERATR
ncbi:hypothetical protein [Actinomadura sp. 9N407]|uniref:hypothetical protein n=1 Tax=Actinomadura sp. 9N407 TaxID=3375154 RepID=UPI0037ABC35D